MKDVVIIPTYNEKENIRKLIETIALLYPNIHILVVDDNSPNGTSFEVERLKKKIPGLDLLLRAKKEGLGRAYKAAFKKVLSDPELRSVCTMDADFAHNPRYLSTMFSEINKFDVVVGSRYVEGAKVKGCSYYRRKLSRAANFYCRALLRLPLKDCTSGFICARTSLLRKINLEKICASGFAFLIELKYLLKKRDASFKEFPIFLEDREAGKSKITVNLYLEGFLLPWRLIFKNFFEKLKNLLAVIQEALKKRGIRFIIYYGPKVLYYTYFKKNKNFFVFQNKKYNYFFHLYNCTCLNERAIEIPIIWQVVKECQGKRILEVGNVLSHYFRCWHDVVDKYERGEAVINQDIVDFRAKEKYDLIVSISTLEHVGLDEDNKDPEKVVRTLQNLKENLKPGGKIIVTMSLGYNPGLDKLLKQGKIKFPKQYFLKRISDKNEWQEATQDEVEGIKYNTGYYSANGLFIGTVGDCF